MTKAPAKPARRRLGSCSIGLEPKPLAAVKRVIAKGLDAHNIAAGGPYRHSDFVVSMRDGKGEIRGGFWVEVYYESAFLRWAWVDPKLQRRGMGRALMQAAEDEARARKAVNLWLDTFSFQAKPFYEKLGFKAFGTLAMGRPGVERYFLTKAL